MKTYPIRKSLVTQHAIERRGIQAGMAPVVLGAGHTKEARWQFQDPTACLKGESIYTVVNACICGVSARLGRGQDDPPEVTWNARVNQRNLKTAKAGEVNHPCGLHFGQALLDEQADLQHSGERENAPSSSSAPATPSSVAFSAFCVATFQL